jgi:hypothetical protein
MSLGSPVQNPSSGPPKLLWHKRYLQALLAKAPALAGYGSGGNLQGISDLLVGSAIWSISIGLKQYASVEQLSVVSPVATDGRFELAALFLGEADNVPLVHSESPRGLTSLRACANRERV